MTQFTEQQPHPKRHAPAATDRTHSTTGKTPPPVPERHAIKIRVVSWNLGDSVPKGDLSSLLGEVPPYHPPDHLVTSLPIFDETDGDGHPYHLIVVAAQECPSASGVPRGLAAGVTKGVIGGLKEKEKLKERGKAKEAKEVEKAEKAWIAQLERIHGTGTEDNSVATTPAQETSPAPFAFPPKPPPKDEPEQPTRGDSTDTTAAGSILSSASIERSAETNPPTQSQVAAYKDTPTEASASTETQATPVATPSIGSHRTPHHGHHTGHVTTGAKGWSDLLEDYLCRGIKHDPTKARTRRTGSISFRQGSISGSLPSTPLQGPTQTPFAKGGINFSPSGTHDRGSNPTSMPLAGEGQPVLSVSPKQIDSTESVGNEQSSATQQRTQTLRHPIPIPNKGLVPPLSLLRGGNSYESRESGLRAPPSPTFSFELQTPTPLSEAPPVILPEEAYRPESSTGAYPIRSIDRHTSSSPLSYASDISPTINPDSSMTDEPESDVAPKSSHSRSRSLLSAITHKGSREEDGNATVRRASASPDARDSEARTGSISPGYFPPQSGQYKDKRLTPLQIPSSGSLSNGNKASPGIGMNGQNHGNGSCSKYSTGPYHFLVKERLLGLYLAIFVHRDCKDWVKGFDHDYVPAGLAGGRIGNKGGIGMSLNMAGHRFLFINSHLAAHAHRVEARIANVAKIKSELHLDCFLPESDPRANAEDITDRYDTVFWMGDLNFRLDISRLHADWLVSRKEYAQALEFDQLRNAMIRGDVFDGFAEAPIDFAPTFKYDVWRSAKRTRSMKKKAEAKNREKGKEAKREGEECIMEVDEDCETDTNLTDDQSSWIGGERRASVDTSAALSTIAGTISEEGSPISERLVTVTQPLRPVAAVAKTTAIKAKHRFMKFIKAATPPVNIPSSSMSSRSSISKSTSPTKSSLFSPPASTWAAAAPDVTTHTYPAHLLENRRQSIDSAFEEGFAAGTSTSSRPGLTRQISSKIKRRFSTSQSQQDANDDDSSSSSEEDIREGVYDSSSKQRVPSWCDRVLWKTIIEEDTSVTSPTSGRPVSPVSKMSRMSHNLASKLHLRKDEHRDELPAQNRAMASPPILSPVVPVSNTPSRDSSPAALTSRHSLPFNTSNFDRHARDSTRPNYARSNPGSSDSSPALSLAETDASARHRLPGKLKHRSISGAMIKSSTSTTATSREHGHRSSVGNLPSPDPRGEHHFLRSRTFGDLSMSRTDTLHHLFSGDGVETSIANAKKWFSHLVRPRSEVEEAQAERSPSPEPEPAPAPPKRKGEVICLKYDTLDDAAMRKLEGRSDHRPIIFAAAVYI